MNKQIRRCALWMLPDFTVPSPRVLLYLCMIGVFAACGEFFLTYGPVLSKERQEEIKAQPHEMRRAARERKVGSTDFLAESYQITDLKDF